ncbi:hypothetical protein CHLNCDRAFT_141134 [Chlorella variabilis]|uniref:Uncharacterized protein n=1 Tax=Chlorella variabilis TaxID=554065 RepID=E1ZS73_CHLVA|nr:hypothetical protein CHLNCDRAFT_141134 [Chlorella variabilis]EFN51364.1 hypothetical protein CHLNCDRAFT_141134 [Chlorella variabilis]|eukprot:XP_005843466.1 hypothetical protein CHLNCDRAFT_141134 [Chlorella variabilis]
MLAWMGGKQRLVAAGKQKTKQRREGGSTTKPAPAWSVPGPATAAAAATHKKRQVVAEEEVRAAAAAGEPAAAGPSRRAAGAAAAGQPRLKRVKAVPHSLDLAALAMPAEWEAPQAAPDTAEDQAAEHPRQQQPLQSPVQHTPASSSTGSQA